MIAARAGLRYLLQSNILQGVNMRLKVNRYFAGHGA